MIQDLPLFVFQAFLPDLFRVVIGTQPVDPPATQFSMTFCQRPQVFFGVRGGLQV